MKIICIGRNYKEHAAEMNSPVPKYPIWFLKPETALIHKNRPFFYPDFSKEIHYETEIVVRINKVGKYIEERFAHTYYDEIGIGLDLTARDLQRECKIKGLPWEQSKAFDGSAPLGKFIPKAEIENVNALDFSLLKNGKLVQKGNTSDMVFGIDQLIAYVSQFVTLKIGDLIFTGTPQGVGEVLMGDQLEAYIGDQLLLKTSVK